MPQVFIAADSLKPSDHAVEQAYSYGPGAAYGPPVLIDSLGDGEQGSLVNASNTRAMFAYGGAVYKLLNRQQAFGTVICKSTDDGATWAVLDSVNSPAFQTCSGYFDGVATVFCAFRNVNVGVGAINLRNFDLLTGTWGAVYGIAGAPVYPTANNTISCWMRPDSTLLVIYPTRSTFGVADPSGIGGAVYDLSGGAWITTFDLGANITALPGWDPTQTRASAQHSTSVMDSTTGVVHCFFNTNSVQTVPVVWGNRCFYQAVLLNNSLGSFFDFPGQVAPFPPFPYARQQLDAFSGSPMGQPVIVNDTIVLPVLMRNDSVIDRFPLQLANVYLGTPLSAPVWALDVSKTIDPGALIDDFIWPQEAPCAFYDGTTIYAVFPAQDEDGQNFARLRLCMTADLTSPADGWTASTAFDLQVDTSFPGFQFPTQQIVTPSVFVPVASPPIVRAATRPPTLGAGRPIRPSSCGCTPEQLEAERIRQRRFNQRAWPFVHVCSPPQTQAVHQVAFIPAPALNTPTVVNSYAVPAGFAFVFQGIIQDFSGGLFVPGGALWNVDINTESGVLNVQAQPLQDLNAIPIPLGSVGRARVWKFKRAYELEPLTLLQSRVTNVSLGVGAPNYFTTGFFGYLILA